MEINCPKCGKTFQSEVKMLDHYDEVHLGVEKQIHPSIPKQAPTAQTIIETGTIPKQKQTTALLTSSALSYLSIFIGLLLLGAFFENAIFFYMSAVPLFFLLAGALLPQPKTVEFTPHEMKSSCFIGERIEFATDVTIDQGFGFLVVRVPLPDHFEVVEGSNFKIIWKGRRPTKDTVSFKVRCTKRGIYVFDKIDWEFRHALGLRQTVTGQFSKRQDLLVQLRTVTIRRIRNTKVLSKLPLPLGALNKTGISTTDFKETREYSPGDPFRTINWKITARMSRKGLAKPFVNEFEREGKKFVWIFIDGSTAMGSHGSVISNAFENGIAAANDLTQYYLERDCFVGLYMYNKKHRLIYPDIGRRQRFKIARALLSMEMAETEPLRESVQRCRSRLVGNVPLCIIITSLSESKTDDLLEGIKELRKYNKSQVRSPILVINIRSYSFAATTEQEKISAMILQSKDYPIEKRLRRARIMVVDWNPVEKPLTNVLLSEVKRR